MEDVIYQLAKESKNKVSSVQKWFSYVAKIWGTMDIFEVRAKLQDKYHLSQPLAARIVRDWSELETM